VPELWLLVLVCGAGTYLWRGLGVALSGGIRPDTPLFSWIGCVAYAMISGLIVRMVLMPSGALSETVLVDRLIACAMAFAAFFLSRRNLFIGVSAGTVALIVLSYGRGVLLA
jgi:branched-subunit amino acid transport protein